MGKINHKLVISLWHLGTSLLHIIFFFIQEPQLPIPVDWLLERIQIIDICDRLWEKGALHAKVKKRVIDIII